MRRGAFTCLCGRRTFAIRSLAATDCAPASLPHHRMKWTEGRARMGGARLPAPDRDSTFPMDGFRRRPAGCNPLAGLRTAIWPWGKPPITTARRLDVAGSTGPQPSVPMTPAARRQPPSRCCAGRAVTPPTRPNSRSCSATMSVDARRCWPPSPPVQRLPVPEHCPQADRPSRLSRIHYCEVSGDIAAQLGLDDATQFCDLRHLFESHGTGSGGSGWLHLGGEDVPASVLHAWPRSPATWTSSICLYGRDPGLQAHRPACRRPVSAAPCQGGDSQMPRNGWRKPCEDDPGLCPDRVQARRGTSPAATDFIGNPGPCHRL